MNRQSLTAAAIAAFFSVACGGSTSDPSERAPSTAGGPVAGQTVVVVTAPVETAVEPGKSVQFTAQVTGSADTSVKWTVDEADGGTIDAAGLYTAPAIEGTYHVRAEHLSQVSLPAVKGASGVVHVKKGATAQPVTVAVSPGTATVPVGGSRGFTAAVTGTANPSVTWSVQPGSSCGSISAAGLYTAPPAGTTCTVVATSAADTTRSGSATVTVTPAPVISVAVSPGSASIATGGTVTFSATVSGTIAGQSSAVTWSVLAGAGSVNASTGAYVAPATAGTYVVTAASVADPSRTATATVTVTAPPPVVAVSISPATAALDGCGTRTFVASVTNAANTAVTWTVVEAGGGTVSGGAYVAPTAPGTYHVMAVSQADPTRSAQATITVGAERVLAVAVVPGSGTVQANGTLAFAALVTTTCGTFAAQ